MLAKLNVAKPGRAQEQGGHRYRGRGRRSKRVQKDTNDLPTFATCLQALLEGRVTIDQVVNNARVAAAVVVVSDNRMVEDEEEEEEEEDDEDDEDGGVDFLAGCARTLKG